MRLYFNEKLYAALLFGTALFGVAMAGFLLAAAINGFQGLTLRENFIQGGVFAGLLGGLIGCLVLLLDMQKAKPFIENIYDGLVAEDLRGSWDTLQFDDRLRVEACAREESGEYLLLIQDQFGTTTYRVRRTRIDYWSKRGKVARVYPENEPALLGGLEQLEQKFAKKLAAI